MVIFTKKRPFCSGQNEPPGIKIGNIYHATLQNYSIHNSWLIAGRKFDALCILCMSPAGGGLGVDVLL